MTIYPKDNSLFFNFYPLNHSVGKLKYAKTGKELFNSKGINHIHFNEIEFDSDKYSYHPDGTIHLKSRSGKRLEDRIKFLPFDIINQPVQFVSLSPAFPPNYPSIDPNEVDDGIIIKSEKDSSVSIQLFLIPKSQNKFSLPPDSNNQRDITASFKGHPLDIIIRVSSVRVAKWSNDHLIVLPEKNINA